MEFPIASGALWNFLFQVNFIIISFNRTGKGNRYC